MKTVLLCFTLCFCSLVLAKNTTKATVVSAQNTSVKSIENEILTSHYGTEFNGPNSVFSPTNNHYSTEGLFYDENMFASVSGFAPYSEFSYKNDLGGGRESQNIIQDNSYTQITALGESQHIFRQGLFYGFTIMLVLVNLVCFFLFEEKTFLFYSLALAATSLLLFHSDGLFNILGLESVVANETIFLLFVTALSALFVSKYLILEEHQPKLKWFTGALLFSASLTLVFAITMENTVLMNVTNTILFTVMTTYFLCGIFLFSRKNYAKFYVIASAIPLLFAFDFFLLRPMGIDFLGTEAVHLKAASIAEMLILTYAIMYRMQSIKEEHAMRQAELRIFLKRQEVLSTRQKTQKLVEDVYLENLIMHYDLDGLEIKLLQYISEGKENAKIARKLKSTENEVEDMIKDLYEKLEISEQIQQDFRMVESQPDYIYN